MIVVTGATGTVGTPLVRGLRERGVPTRAVLHTAVRPPASSQPGVQSVTADLGDISTLVPALAHAEAVFVLTPVHPRMAQFVRNVIDAAARGGGRPRIVSLAAAGVDQGMRGVRFLDAHAEGLTAPKDSGAAVGRDARRHGRCRPPGNPGAAGRRGRSPRSVPRSAR
ncbi:SDR family oxidoreductase [[Actinomadura] parvosata]|uniref:SDR family oxidoreductase n=1 Tax=[Actinomadura] parvosata TaxID=1955412 RepID=UPI00406CE2E3